jgi:drug/metabolite transporter (DMT)-like permease
VGFWNALGYCAQSIALTSTSASKSAFICSLAVIFVPILDSLFSSKTVADGSSDSSSGSGKWTAALLATAGVACLELGGIEPPVIGDLWALAQPICFGECFDIILMF